MAITYEQAAAHEAGHAVLGLAMGAQLLDITMIEGEDPAAFLPGSPDATFATSFVPTSTIHIEARLGYLIAVGGMAGEAVFEGGFHTPGAADDVARLRGVKLEDAQIQGLTEIAKGVINANLDVWRKIQRRFLSGIARKEAVLVKGIPINTLFKRTGKKFIDFSKLDGLLPLDD